MTREEIVKDIADKKLIAIIRGMEPEYCEGFAKAIYEGGIRYVEVTFNQKATDGFKATTDSIQAIISAMGEKMVVGAGTVLTREQVDLTVAAGGRFIVTPSLNLDVLRYAQKKGLVTLPGVLTPTEAVAAYEAGADFVKIFPAGNLGPGYIKAIKAPLSHIPMLAVGGVNEKNFAEFLQAGAAGAGVGGNLVNKDWIKAGEFDKITALAKEFVNCTR